MSAAVADVACECSAEFTEAVRAVDEGAEEVVAFFGRQVDFVELSGVAAFNAVGEREVGVAADPVGESTSVRPLFPDTSTVAIFMSRAARVLVGESSRRAPQSRRPAFARV